MTIDKAIEILTDSKNSDYAVQDGDFFDAVDLGIEALKRHQETQGYNFSGFGVPLPGEADA